MAGCHSSYWLACGQRSASFAARYIVAYATIVAEMSLNLEIGFAAAVRLAARSTLALLLSM
jgi:hypothetical protein